MLCVLPFNLQTTYFIKLFKNNRLINVDLPYFVILVKLVYVDIYYTVGLV